MKAIIKPVQVFPTTATKLYINNVCVNLGDSVSLQWWLQNSNDESLISGVVNISGPDYLLWNNDNYLYDYVSGQIGVEILSMES